MQYQGHMNDGSSIQNHSVGDLYPCVIYAQETRTGLKYGVITPTNQNGQLVGAHSDAVQAAQTYLRTH